RRADRAESHRSRNTARPGRRIAGKERSREEHAAQVCSRTAETNAGTAKIFGEDVWNLSGETKARIGYVPQKADLYPWMKVKQMVNYIAAFYPTWNSLLLTTLLSRWELEEDDRIDKLSEGQRQKLSLFSP